MAEELVMNEKHIYPSFGTEILKDKLRYAPKFVKQFRYNCIAQRIILRTLLEMRQKNITVK